MQFLATSPLRKRDSCLPLGAMDFPKLHVLKHLVEKMKKDEMCREKNARRVGQTQTTKGPLSAHIVLPAQG